MPPLCLWVTHPTSGMGRTGLTPNKRERLLCGFGPACARSLQLATSGRFRPITLQHGGTVKRTTGTDPGCVKSPVDCCRWDESASFHRPVSLSGRKLGIAARNAAVFIGCLPPTQITTSFYTPWTRSGHPSLGGECLLLGVSAYGCAR